MCRFAVTVMTCLAYFVLASVLNSSSAYAGTLFYISDDRGALGTVNPSTGNVSKIGAMAVVMTDIAINSDGELFGISYDDLYRINQRTADVTWVGRHNIPGANALTFSADGELFAAGSASTKLYSINPSTAKATIQKEIGFASAGDLAYAQISCPPNALCIRADSLYMSSTSGDLVSIPDHLPEGRKIGAIGVNNMFGLAGGPNGELYGFAGSTLYAIDTWNASARILSSLAGQGMGRIYGSSIASIPEPASEVLAVFAGVATLALASRRRIPKSLARQ